MPEKWEKQENETQKNYNLFCVYRDLGITRSLRKVVEKLQKPERYIGNLSNLSAKFGWVERCNSYDEYIDSENQKANIERIRKMNADTATIAEKVRQLAGLKIQAIYKRVEGAVKSGNMEELDELLKDIPVSMIPALMESGFEVQRKALGVNDKVDIDAKVQHTIDPEAVRNKILSKLRGHEDDAHSGNTSQSPES